MLRRSLLLTLMLIAAPALAGGFDFIPAANDAQKDVIKRLNNGDYKRALEDWGPAFAGTSFGNSANGVAVKALLLEQSGMPFTGTELLLRFSQPSRIDYGLLKMWTTELRNSPAIQKGWIQTTGEWKSIVNNDPVILKLKRKTDVLRAFTQADRISKDNVNEKARVWWQIATQAPQFDDVDDSLKAIKLMRESGQSIIGQDQIWMTQGRVLYQKKELDAALNAYEQIPKSSDLWVEAVDERAWTHLRKDDYDKATAVVTTALSPVLAPLAGPETFFLANLLAYRVCDYVRLFNNDELFKKRHKRRMNEIQDLAVKGSNESLPQVLARFEQNGVSKAAAGSLVDTVPDELFRDRTFIRAVETRRAIANEEKIAAKYFGGEGAVVGADLDRILNDNRTTAERLQQAELARARSLAQVDLKEYRIVLNKMQILEAEVIQRINLDDNLKGQRSKLSKFDKHDSNKLVFPYSDEVWMDELDNYQARVKDCPTLKKASL